MAAWTPKKLSPKHIRVLALWMQGDMTHDEIGQLVGLTGQQVCNIVNSPAGQEALSTLHDGVFDTVDYIRNQIPAIVPSIMDKKIRLALQEQNLTVADKSCTDLLQMAGHKPVSRVVLERERDDPHAGKSEAELRDEILRELGVSQAPQTVH